MSNKTNTATPRLYADTDAALAEAEASVHSLTVWELDSKGKPMEEGEPMVNYLDGESAAAVTHALAALEAARKIVAWNARENR